MSGLIRQDELEKAIKAHLKRAGTTQAAVARKLHYAPDQFNKWIRGVNRIPDTVIQEISDVLALSNEERTELFTLAGYVAVTALNRKDGPAPPIVSINLNSDFFVDALKDWVNHVFRLSDASAHLRSSWTGLVIHALSVMASRITPHGFLIFCVSLLLGIITTQLVTPVLQWPLDEPETRWLAYVQYGLATLLVPLLVASVTPPDTPGLFQLATNRQQVTFWLLKYTGAVVGFWVFSTIVVGIAMVWYYLHFPLLPAWIGWILALIPLFFSYIVARRIPLDRHKMFEGDLRLHPVDRLFLAVFIPAGPFLAAFLYFSYWLLSDRNVAPVTLVTVATVIALWEYRKRHADAISDPILILILGFFVPILILFYAFYTTPDLSPASLTELPLIVVASTYILSWTLLLATILVRNPPTLTLTGVFSLLGITILAVLIAALSRWVGVVFGCLVILIWGLWGRKRFSQTFWVHNSFWVMVVATGTWIYLSVSSTIPIWANGLSFTIISALIISWAYRTPHRKELPVNEAT